MDASILGSDIRLGQSEIGRNLSLDADIYMEMVIGKFQVGATNIPIWNADHMMTNHQEIKLETNQTRRLNSDFTTLSVSF